MRVEFNGKLDILSIITAADIEPDCESYIDEVGLQNRRESF